MSKTRIVIGICWGLTIVLVLLGLLFPSTKPTYLPALVFWPLRFFIPFASRLFKMAFFIELFTIIGLVVAVAFTLVTIGAFLGKMATPCVIGLMLLTLAWSDVMSFRRAGECQLKGES